MNDDPLSPAEPENPWKLALEGSGVGVWDWNLATGAQTHSAHWEEMLGYVAGELRRGYQDFVALVHPDDLDMVQEESRAYGEGHSPKYQVDFRMRCKDGSWKWILACGTVVERDAQGKPVRMIGTHTDISARKHSEDALRQANAELLEKTQLLQTTLTSVSQGILLLDAEDRVRMFNPQICELLRLPHALLTMHPSLQELAQYQLERGDFGPEASLVDSDARAYILAVAQGGEAPPYQYLRLTPDGRTLEIRSQTLPSGGMVRTVADVTAHVQAEATHRRLNQLLDATQTIAQVGAWERDFINNTVFWTDGVYRILETTPQ